MSKINPLKAGYKYYANFVRYIHDKYTSFSVGIKQQDGSYQNYGFFCFEVYDWLKDGTPFVLDEIISVEQREYKGKPQFQITARISPKYEDENLNYADNLVDELEEDYNTNEPTLDISADDLPF